MSKFESVAVPFIEENGRQILTERQLAEQPWLREFIERFRHCFVHDMMREVWIYEPPND